jgi:hypothetical protein
MIVHHILRHNEAEASYIQQPDLDTHLRHASISLHLPRNGRLTHSILLPTTTYPKYQPSAIAHDICHCPWQDWQVPRRVSIKPVTATTTTAATAVITPTNSRE